MTPFINLFRRYLREQGLPITQQREVVADVVFSTAGHLSVEDIEGALKGHGERIGKATIYRTLDLLVKSKLVEEHDFGEGFKRYEHLFGHQPVHEHLICTSCSEVIEFQSPEVIRLQEEMARQGISRKDLARILGCTEANVAQMLTGHRTHGMRLQTLEKLAEALGCGVVLVLIPQSGAERISQWHEGARRRRDGVVLRVAARLAGAEVDDRAGPP